MRAGRRALPPPPQKDTPPPPCGLVGWMAAQCLDTMQSDTSPPPPLWFGWLKCVSLWRRIRMEACMRMRVHARQRAQTWMPTGAEQEGTTHSSTRRARITQNHRFRAGQEAKGLYIQAKSFVSSLAGARRSVYTTQINDSGAPRAQKCCIYKPNQ